MDLETCCVRPPAAKEAEPDVIVSRPVPSAGPSFPLTSVQFFLVLGGVKVPVFVPCARGSPVDPRDFLLQLLSKTRVEDTDVQLTGNFQFLFSMSNKVCASRTSMRVRPGECGDVRSGLFASAPVGP